MLKELRTRADFNCIGITFAIIAALNTASPASAQTAPSLGSAQSFAVLAASTVTNTGPSIVTGDLGVSLGPAVTGFPPGAVVLGAIHDGNATAIAAQGSLTTVYNDLVSQACTVDLTGQDLGGKTLTAGVYCFVTSAQLTGTLTLDAQGNANAVFIFKMGTTLTTAAASTVVLINGGSLCNVFWQVGSSATLGANTSFAGNILALTSITMGAGASVTGRVLARNGAVTMDNNAATVPCPAAAPTVALTAPAANATVSGLTAVSATASAALGVAGVQFQLDGAPLGAEDVTAPYSVSWTTTNATNGLHTLTAVARDVATNQTTSAAVSVTVANDTAPPVVSAVAASSITTAGATITWTTNEASSSQVDYGPTTAYGSASALDGSLVTAHTVSLSGLTGSALYHVRARSRDAAGNLALSSDVTFTTLDGTAPAVALTAPAANATVSGAVTVTATASDSAGVAGVQFQLDGAPLGAEDVTAPYSVSWTTATATNGPHTLTAVARDAATNQTTSAARSITVDKTFPVISAVAVSSITATGATFTWTTDEPSDTQVNYGLTTAYGTNTPLVTADVTSHSVVRTGLTPNTTYHYRVRSRDAALPGNLALSGDLTFTTPAGADVTAPTVSVSAPSPGATVGGTVTVTATASDNVGVAGVQFRVDGAPLGVEDLAAPFTLLWDSTTATDGLHALTAVARDAAMNQTTSAARTVTVANDVTPPVISAVGASSITADGATIAWTTNEASDSQVEYGVTTAYGSTSALNGSLVTSHSMVLSGLAANATYHYRVRSEDAAGNLAPSADFTFTTLDATAPTVSVSAPSPGATVGGTVTVSATAADTMGVAGVQFRVDGAPLGAEDVTAPYGVSWNTTGSVDLVFGVTKVIVLPMAMTAGSGFTKRLSLSCPACPGEDMVSQDRIQTAAGPAAATWTFSSPAHYLAQMAAFKATGTPAYVQGAVATSNSPSTMIAQTLDANVGTGNLLVVAVAWQGTSAVSVTDSRGNGYAVATQAYDAVNGQSLAILYAANTAGGATTVTASFGASPTAQRLEIHEYSGIATTNPLDVTATNIADGTTTANAVTSGSATPSGIAPVANGSHTLTAQARDAAGNTTMSAAVTVTVNNGGDTTPPVISGVTVSAITSSGATFNWTTNEASDTEVEYGPTTAYGGFSTLNVTRVTAHTMSLSGLAAGTLHHYRVRSRDAAGNLGLSGDLTFTTLEGTPPTVAITAPAQGAMVSGTVTVTANASDNVGVVGVQFRVDGVALGAEDTVAPYAVSWNTSTASPGSPVLTAVARDAAGNQRTSSPVTVTVATADVTLAWNPNSESDLDGYKLHFGTAAGSYSVHVDVGNVTSYTVSGLQPGTAYYFAVTAYDLGGAESGASNEVSASR